MIMIDALGWVATAVVVSSYFCHGPTTMRRVQIAGALVWATYGLLLGAYPVVVANVLVISAAAWSLRDSDRRRAPLEQAGEHPRQV
jgi:Bacterial inner membrane protein